MPRPRQSRIRGLLPRLLVLCLAALVLGAQPAPSAAPADAAVPGEASWPDPLLTDGLRDLLRQYYGQAGEPASLGDCLATYTLIAPFAEAQKAPAWKDPDTLWESLRHCEVQAGLPDPTSGTSCRGAASEGEHLDCAGRRVARARGIAGYAGGATLFDPAARYYDNRATAMTAAQAAQYHAFVHDFDAANGPLRSEDPAACAGLAGYGAGGARDHRCYHKRMIRAYEAHVRAILAAMFERVGPGTETFQADMSREIGLLALDYARLVQTVEELGAWSPVTRDADRRDALALLTASAQRIWWEWVWPQQSGPRTAGHAALGSQDSYDQAAQVHSVPSWSGSDNVTYSGAPLASLREPGPVTGIRFDADYAMPGAGWCEQFAPGDPSRARCLAHAARLGTKSAGANLGSIAEEWLWAYGGARAAMSLLEAAMLGNDSAQQGSGAIGANRDVVLPFLSTVKSRPEYAIVSDRLGYGVAGWHGGDGAEDDLEWLWAPHPSGNPEVQAIRTLSGGQHDGEAQFGRHSLGELDAPMGGVFFGGMYDLDGQEAAGAIENHAPGPNPLYTSSLLQLVLSDRTSAGMAGSFYDLTNRNRPDEFEVWLRLLGSALFRCRGAGLTDPADPRCATPGSPELEPLYVRPDDRTPASLDELDYLWRGLEPPGSPPIDEGYVAEAKPGACGWKSGLPWRRTGLQPAAGPQTASLLLDESGLGAWNHLVPLLGGTMRVLSARLALEEDAAARARYRVAYDDARSQLAALLDLLADPAAYGYVPELENGPCLEAGGTSMASIMGSSGLVSFEEAVVLRAEAYTRLALWYGWYDSAWLDIDAAVWDGPPAALPLASNGLAPARIQTGIQVQNLDPDDEAALHVDLYRHGQGNATVELHPSAPAGGARNLFMEAGGADGAVVKTDAPDVVKMPLPAGAYAALVRSDRPVGAIARLDWPDTRGAALYSDLEPTTDLILPLVEKAVAGRSTAITVMNAGDGLATASAELRAADGGLALSLPLILAPGEAQVLDLGGLPPGFVGSLRLRSADQGTPPDTRAQPLAAQALTEIAGVPAGRIAATQGYESQDATPAEATLFVPLWRAGQVVGATELDTRIAIANTSAAPATVTVTYRRSPRTDTCPTVPQGWSTTQVQALPAGGSAILSQDPGLSGLPPDCFGSATIEVAPPGARVVAAVEDETALLDGTRLLSSFVAPPSSGASTRVALPLYRRNWAGLTTGIQVVNTANAPANVSITFRATNRPQDPPVVIPRSIAARDSENWWPGSIPQLLDQTFGSAVVESDQPVVVLVNDYPLAEDVDPATYLGLPVDAPAE